MYYKGNHRTIIGPDHELRWPLNTQKLDYELELACVIGRKGIDIAERDAANYIAGYTIMNDFSARDIQFQEMACRLGPAKGKDFATAIGPCIVTPDDIQDLAALRMIARINGEVWSEGRFGTIHWSFSQMIEHVSRGEFLYPGDLFGSGTVGGFDILGHLCQGVIGQGEHILVRNTPSQLEILHQGDFHVKHLYPICSKEMGFNTMDLV